MYFIFQKCTYCDNNISRHVQTKGKKARTQSLILHTVLFFTTLSVSLLYFHRTFQIHRIINKRYRIRQIMSSSSLIQQQSQVTVTVTKPEKDSTIGLSLNYVDGGKIVARSILDDGLFANTELQAGFILLSVNDTIVKGMSTPQVMKLFVDSGYFMHRADK